MHILLSIFLIASHRQTVRAKYVGNWEPNLSGISGSIHFESPTTVALHNFYYGGSSSNLYFYYYDNISNVGTYKGTYLYFEQAGSRQDFYIFSRPYINETVLGFMPSGKTICDIRGLAMWSLILDTAYSVLFILSNNRVSERRQNGECVIKGSSNADKDTPNKHSIKYDNCETVHGTFNTLFNVYWALDTRENKLHTKICMCDAAATSKLNFYMAFGRTGPGPLSMVGGDVTVAWIDKQLGRPLAADYFLKSRQQCYNGEGVCRDDYFTNDKCTDDVVPGSVTGGINSNGEVCISYSRLLKTKDSKCDIELNSTAEEPMMIAAGYMGDSVLKHFTYSSYIKMKFGRTPWYNCRKLVCSHDCKKFKGSQLILLHSTKLLVVIVPSGFDQGYSSITGQPNWGNVAFSINDHFMPEIVVRRGQTYTFVVSGGHDHPLYITSSKTGGWLQKSIQQRSMETIYAGFNSTGQPIQGSRIHRINHVLGIDASSCILVSEAQYTDLMLTSLAASSHSGGEPGVFNWTPDQDTPDVVYYQCAQHPNHGWRIVVQPESFEFVTPRKLKGLKPNNHFILATHMILLYTIV